MYHLIKCPHCQGGIIIAGNEINCKIFRHGVFKINSQQINPHECKEQCEKFYRENAIFGCGKPFRFDGVKVEKCDYI